MTTPVWMRRARRSRRFAALLACVAIAALGSATYAVVLAVNTLPAPPTPTITSGPANPTSSSSATFTFNDPGASADPDHNHDTDPVIFQCSLDGGAFKACKSPKTYTKLGEATHSFRVNARQEDTATSSPATYTWVIRKTAPAITLSFPFDGGSYNAASWNAGCSPAGYCGGASDSAGVAQVQLSIKRNSDGTFWNGSSFSGSSQTFVNATLSAPGGTLTAWSYAFAFTKFPADGKYALAVRATDGAGNQTGSNNYVKATFTIDTKAPPKPKLTQTPPSTTSSTDATFAFTDGENNVVFKCSLDGAAYTACTSPITYHNLSASIHTFAVIACDAAGNCSAAATFTWTVTTQSFTVNGNAVGTFYPGASALPINLVITNPFNTTLTVTSVTVTITGTNHAACGAGNFTVVQNLQGSVDIPANSTKSLSDVGYPQVDWPMVKMIETGTNQDACQTATVNFSYSGNGTHP